MKGPDLLVIAIYAAILTAGAAWIAGHVPGPASSLVACFWYWLIVKAYRHGLSKAAETAQAMRREAL